MKCSEEMGVPQHSFHTLARLYSKSYKVDFSTMWTENSQNYKLDFEGGRGTRDQIANICWIMEKDREFQKKHLLLLHWLCKSLWLSRPLVINLGLLRSFGLQLPEAFTTSCPDWGFWELQFKSIRVTKVKNHCIRWTLALPWWPNCLCA